MALLCVGGQMRPANVLFQTGCSRKSRLGVRTPWQFEKMELLRWAHAARGTQSVVLRLFKRTATQTLDSHGLAQGHPVLTINAQSRAKVTPPETALWITPTSSPFSATGAHVLGEAP